MENTITVNNKTSDAPVLTLSDNDTDRLLKLITGCAKSEEMTGSQLELIEYLDDLKYKNGYDSGTVSFDIGEMPWNFADFATGEGPMRAGGNRKGLFTRDRRPKMAAHYFRNRWEGK